MPEGPSLVLLKEAARPLAELSGGQRQRVWVAMALAQDTDLLLLDEPTTFLDINHQVELLDLLTDLNRERRTTIVIVLHDLNLACRYADHIIAMKEGRILAEGPPREVIDADVATEVFGLRIGPQRAAIRAAYVDLSDRKRLIERLVQDGRVDGFEVQMRRADGTTMWAILSARAILIGGQLAMLVTITDITERKAAQVELEEREE